MTAGRLHVIDCACGQSIAGTPAAAAVTYGHDHAGPDHRVQRIRLITPAALARLVRGDRR